MPKQQLTYGGYCSHCQTIHTVQSTLVWPEAKSLIAELEISKALVPSKSQFSTNVLFGKARGQMLGIMIARDSNGKTHTLKAFSGQFNGHYRATGWVPPIFDVDKFHRINTPEEKHIKALSKRLLQTIDPIKQQAIKQERRTRSRALMKKIHDLYTLHNFHGEQQKMSSFFPKGKGMPTGAGDCCAPKLIQYAIKQKLTPLSMIEFYFGLENKSKTRQHGVFYPPCESGCAPILGFMLCGLHNETKEKL